MKQLLIALSLGFSLISFSQNSLNMNLLGSKSYSNELNDVWGYVSPSGTEYALVGVQTGLSIVNISNPANPVEQAFIPGPTSVWRDIKTWGNYAYVMYDSYSGGPAQGILIVDLSNIATTTNPQYYTFFPVVNGQTYDRAHNLYIDENGVLYVFGANIGVGGALMFDLTQTPTNPGFLGIFNDYYFHDGMARGDTLWGGAIYQGLWVAVDVSNKANPQIIGSYATPYTFTHNCWISDDNETLYTTDEISNAVIGIYDVSGFGALEEIGRATSQNPNSGVIPHNTHVDGDFIVTSYYRDGVTVHDVTYPYNPVLTGYYDCSPQFSGNGFNGAWGAYPYFPSGIIAVTDIENGLFLFDFPDVKGCYLEGTVTDANSNAPILTAQIELLGSPTNTSVDLSGFYAIGLANGGNFSAVYSAPGYQSDTVPVTLQNGVLVVQDAALQPFEQYQVTGRIDDASGNGIEGATVQVTVDGVKYTATTDNLGLVTFNNLFSGTYDVLVGAWGYQTECYTVNITGSAASLSTVLESGYYDDFALDFGWQSTGTASTGYWDRVIPVGTTYGSAVFNPDVDASGDCEEYAFVTGNNGANAGADDVDDGYVTLESPVFDLSGYGDARMSFYTWFANDGGSGNPDDSLIVYLSNGLTEVPLVTKTAQSTVSQWELHEFIVANEIAPTANMKLRVKASDLPPNGHLVEGGFDVFSVVDSASSGVGLEEFAEGFRMYPNPANELVTLSHASQSGFMVEVRNLQGQLVYSNSTTTSTLALDVSGWAKGMYLVEMVADHGNRIRRSLNIVE